MATANSASHCLSGAIRFAIAPYAAPLLLLKSRRLESPNVIPARLPPLGPPKRLFEFVRDVAPGDADIVQVVLGPACELPAISITLPPEMKGLRERRQPLCHLAGQLLVEIDERLDISGDHVC